MIDLDEIRPKISGEVLSTWRAYQRELHAHGVSAEAERLNAEVRALLDLDDGDELDEPAMHHLAFIRGRRPLLISRQTATTAAPSAPECGSQSEPQSAPKKPKPTPAPKKRKPMSDDELVAMHRECQHLLAFGRTPVALDAVVDLHRALCREWDLDVFDEDAHEIALDVLHAAAWPDASARAARLIIEGCGGSPFE